MNHIEPIEDERTHTNVPILKRHRLKIFLIALAILGIAIIPRLISGTFEYTLGHFLFACFVLIVFPIIMLTVMKRVILNHIDYDENNLTNKGLTIAFITLLILLIISVGLLTIARFFPMVELLSVAPEINRLIGMSMFTVFVIIAIIFKAWPLLFVLFVLALPEIYGQYFVGDTSPEDAYVFISMISIIGISILAIIIMSVIINRDSEKDDDTSL